MTDSIIIGGGLIGLFSAAELAIAGQRVTLVDDSGPRGKASWAAGGLLVPMHPWRMPAVLRPAIVWSQQRYIELSAELPGITGIDPEREPCGLILLEARERALALDWARDSGEELVEINAPELYRLEPGLHPGHESALWYPGAAHIRNPRLLQAMREWLRQLGVKQVQAHCQNLLLKATRVQGVMTTDGPLQAQNTVLAAGAWSPPLLEAYGGLPSIRPMRGQMISYQLPVGMLRHIILEGERYLIPRRDGCVLVGSTLEDAGYELATTSEARHTLQQAAQRLMPSLQDFAVRDHWAGLRPGKEDSIPYIGAHPHLEGLYLNVGQYRNGILIAPASGRLLADRILQRTPVIDPECYIPFADQA